MCRLLPTFQNKVLPPHSECILKMEASAHSKVSVPIYQTIRYQIPKTAIWNITVVHVWPSRDMPWRHRWGAQVYLQSSLTSELGGSECLTPRLDRFTPGMTGYPPWSRLRRLKGRSGRVVSLVFSHRGRVSWNQSPVMRPVWLWHTASWASSWG